MSNLTFDFRAGDAIYEYDESPPDRTGRDCDVRPADHSDGQQGCYKKSQLVSKKFKRQLTYKASCKRCYKQRFSNCRITFTNEVYAYKKCHPGAAP